MSPLVPRELGTVAVAPGAVLLHTQVFLLLRRSRLSDWVAGGKWTLESEGLGPHPGLLGDAA